MDAHGSLFAELATTDGGRALCGEWAEHLTAWAEQHVGAVPGREEVVGLLAEGLLRFVAPLPGRGLRIRASLDEVAAAVGASGEGARRVGRVLACHRQAVPAGASPAVEARRHALEQMLRARPERAVPAALAGSGLLKGRAHTWVTAVVVGHGPSVAPTIHLTLHPDSHQAPPIARGPDLADDAVVEFGMTAVGPGGTDSLHQGVAYGTLLAALPGLDAIPAELPLGRLLHTLLVDDVIGVISPTRCAVLAEHGARRPDRSWQPLLTELATDPGQSVWAGPALLAWTAWARQRHMDLVNPADGRARVRFLPDAALPRAGALQVVAPDGTCSTVRITAARLVDWEPPAWRRHPWERPGAGAPDQ
ncbi:hypothetical protein P3T35_000481 [Kitasatospora sp. GP30]|uniref:hypothetical protein n=1 Tax=Kitasatospora sp. GP30 TaxID=3035084 RepID=UPI000C706339|nr:hypothetical protein [Kitasatospora sp. GP30]MDH6138504.1 hypothetical protein [Kitasatospora sp. GP30]